MTTQDNRRDPYMSPPLKRAGDTISNTTHVLQDDRSDPYMSPPPKRAGDTISNTTHVLEPLDDPPFSDVPDKHAMLGGAGYNTVQVSGGPREGVHHTLIPWRAVHLKQVIQRCAHKNVITATVQF